MSDLDIDPEKKELREKYKHVDGERVRFWSEGALESDNPEVGDWLLWDGAEVKQVERIDVEEYDEYYIVQEIDRDVNFEGFLCYADMRLTGQYSFEDLDNLYSDCFN